MTILFPLALDPNNLNLEIPNQKSFLLYNKQKASQTSVLFHSFLWVLITTATQNTKT